MRTGVTRVLLLLLLIAQVTSAAAQRSASDDPAVRSLAATAARLRTTDPRAPLNDLRALDRLVEGRRIVSVGANIHGSRELPELTHRVFRYLVERHQFTVLAVQLSYHEALPLDHFVRTGEGSPEALLYGLSVWPWRSYEFLDLLRTIRNWNADPGHTRKVRIIGIDSGGGWRFGVRYLRAAFGSLDPAFAAQIGRFDEFVVRHSTDSAGIAVRLDSLAERLRQDSVSFADRTPPPDWFAASRAIVGIRQNVELLRPGSSARLRERHLADNVEWALTQGGPDGRLFVWVHGRHTSRAAAVPGADDAPEWADEVPMGHHLSERFGPAYLAIGTEFGAADFVRRRGDPLGPAGEMVTFRFGAAPEGSLGHTLAASFRRPALLSFAKPPPLVRRWLQDDIPAYTDADDSPFHIPALVRLRLGEHYDAMLFVPRLSAARVLQWGSLPVR